MTVSSAPSRRNSRFTRVPSTACGGCWCARRLAGATRCWLPSVSSAMNCMAFPSDPMASRDPRRPPLRQRPAPNTTWHSVVVPPQHPPEAKVPPRDEWSSAEPAQLAFRTSAKDTPVNKSVVYVGGRYSGGVPIASDVLVAVGRRIDTLWPQLTERQRRALLGAEARELGWGGVTAVAKVAGVARSTVSQGLAELDLPAELEPGRSRRAGGGRRSAVIADPGLAGALDALVRG